MLPESTNLPPVVFFLFFFYKISQHGLMSFDISLELQPNLAKTLFELISIIDLMLF